MGRKRIPSSPLNPFYGYSAEEVAEVCGVSVGTAQHYRAGRRKPPTPVLRLWRLHREGRILTDDAWDGFRIVGDKIFAPGDSRPFTPVHLYLYGLVWQALAEANPDRYYALLEDQRTAK